MPFVLLGVALVVVLAVAAWQIAPRYNRTLWRRGKPGSVWLHDPTGNVVPEDDEFKKPRDEGERL